MEISFEMSVANDKKGTRDAGSPPIQWLAAEPANERPGDYRAAPVGLAIKVASCQQPQTLPCNVTTA